MVSVRFNGYVKRGLKWPFRVSQFATTTLFTSS